MYYFNPYTKESQWDMPTTEAKPSAGGAREEVRASHLLVKHRGSRNPRSWRQVCRINVRSACTWPRALCGSISGLGVEIAWRQVRRIRAW